MIGDTSGEKSDSITTCMSLPTGSLLIHELTRKGENVLVVCRSHEELLRSFTGSAPGKTSWTRIDLRSA